MDLWNMEDVIDQTKECLLNLIVVGDSMYEMEAAQYFKDNMKLEKRCILKQIKL